MAKLAEAPASDINMVNYIIAGATPIASAQELAGIINEKIPGAQLDFDPDLELQKVLDKLLLPIDDRLAREEWGWASQYDQERIVDDFIMEMKTHPERYE